MSCLHKKGLPFIIPKNGILALYDSNGNEIFGVLKCTLVTGRREGIPKLDAEILVNLVNSEEEMKTIIKEHKCENN